LAAPCSVSAKASSSLARSAGAGAHGPAEHRQGHVLRRHVAYAAFAIGAPAGTALYAGYGFAAIALAATLIPLAVLPLVAPMRPASATSQTSAGLIKVAGAVWLPGLGVALSGVGFGAIITFIGLLFAQRAGARHGLHSRS